MAFIQVMGITYLGTYLPNRAPPPLPDSTRKNPPKTENTPSACLLTSHRTSPKMPLVQERWTPHGLKGWKIASYAGADAPYGVHAWLEWESKGHADAAIASEDGAAVFRDVPKFCDVKPVLLSGEQVASASW